MNSNNIKHKKTTTYDGENLGPGLGQEGGVVKPVNRPPLDYWMMVQLLTITVHQTFARKGA